MVSRYGQGDVIATRRDGDHWEALAGHYDGSTRRWPYAIQGGLSAWWGEDTVFAAALGVVDQPLSRPYEYAGGLMLDNATGRQTTAVPYAACYPCQPRADSLGDSETSCRLFPTPTPTATPTHTMTPTPSVTPTPSATATQTATPQPSPTVTAVLLPSPTRSPQPVYLPLLLREHCDPTLVRADIALVIDTSDSMSGQKLADAKSAAATFVGLLDLYPARDQVAVIRFDSEAELVHGLSADRPSVEAAIAALDSREGTHIDAGLRVALEELQGPRRIGNDTPVMVLLTDGIHTGEQGAEVAAAEEVRGAGIFLYTIGLGADVDAPSLIEMAGDVGRYYFAPDSSHLQRIYHEVARDIDCPAEMFWGGP